MTMLYRECPECHAPRRQLSFTLDFFGTLYEESFQFGPCRTPWCSTNIPLNMVITATPPHMTRPNPCGDPACGCSGKPWWFPGQYTAQHLDTP